MNFHRFGFKFTEDRKSIFTFRADEDSPQSPGANIGQGITHGMNVFLSCFLPRIAISSSSFTSTADCSG